MTEKAFRGETDPLVEDLGGGVHVPFVKVMGAANETYEDTGFTLSANGDLESETQTNTVTGATRTRIWTYTTLPNGVVSASAGAWQ